MEIVSQVSANKLTQQCFYFVQFCLISITLPCISHAAVVPYSSLLQAEATSYTETAIPRYIQTRSQGSTIDPLAVSVTHSTTGANTSTNIAANWVNPGQGNVNFYDMDLYIDTVNASTTARHSGLFTYNFEADVTGDLSVDYNIISQAVGVNAATYLNQSLYEIRLWEQGVGWTDSFRIGQNASGLYSVAVTADTGYQLAIQRFYYAATTNAAYSGIYLDAQQRADFIWQLPIASPSAVPVPAAVWLFGSGLLGFLVVAKRKSQT